MKIINLVLSEIEGLKFKILPPFDFYPHSQILSKVEKLIFYLLVFSIPIQLGKHFWPPFSYVNGIRIDYLSPTLYFTDVLIILLFSFSLFRVAKNRFRLSCVIARPSALRPSLRLEERNDEAIPSTLTRLFRFLSVARNDIIKEVLRTKKKNLVIHYSLFIIPFFVIIFSTITSKQSLAAFYSILKILEFVFLGFYISKKINKQNIFTLISLLSISAIIFSLIGITQFLKQQSIGGLFYFLGERTFNSSTIGIANMDIDGKLILRPYSTFAHPNVFAFYLFFVNIIVLSQIFVCKDKIKKLFFLFALLISTIALFLTFSRIIIILYIIFLLIFFLRNKVKKIFVLLLPLSFVLFFVYLNNFYFRFFDINLLLKDLYLRQDLVNISLQIFKGHPLFGVGLNNFFYYEAEFQKTITPTLFQPVHNIFILTLVETGILGFIFFCAFLIKSFKVLNKKIKEAKRFETKIFYNSVLFIFISMLVVGLFDHFFLTLQQGQMLLALILGLSWTRIK